MEKNHELTHLEHFKEICISFPDGEIEKSEKPDFLVHTGQKILGIEHTEMFQPGPSTGISQQAQDNLGQRVVSRANELYLQRHSRSLLVQILFNQRVMIRKKDVDRIAERVLQVVEAAPTVLDKAITMRRTRENTAYFPKEIVMLHIYPQPSGEETKWRSSIAGRIPKITPEHIQRKINQKELKLDHYNSRCSEIWLLIVADDFRIPSTVDLSELVLEHQYQTRFDKVFFFWNSTRRYVEFQLTNGQSKNTSA